MNILKWFLFTAAQLGTLYLGLVEHNDGALNVALFLSWFCFAMSLLAMTSAAKEPLQKPRTIPGWLNGTIDVAIATTLVWHGYVWTGAFYLLHFYLIETARAVALSELEEESGEAAL